MIKLYARICPCRTNLAADENRDAKNQFLNLSFNTSIILARSHTVSLASDNKTLDNAINTNDSIVHFNDPIGPDFAAIQLCVLDLIEKQKYD